MPKIPFNPVSLLVNLTIGWFILSFLQASIRVLLSGARGDLIQRFKSIAFFHEAPAAIINVGIMLVIWIVAMTIWYMVRQR